ncbi:hypothetical protein [Paenibacillus sp. FSL K6-0108]|uniref:hypothetical protein n=1 Tax=Paenibacillus sp. FSL K6-0108 TaxID=2921417 RepID=UPI00324B3C55
MSEITNSGVTPTWSKCTSGCLVCVGTCIADGPVPLVDVAGAIIASESLDWFNNH